MSACQNCDYLTPNGALNVLRGIVCINAGWAYIANLDDEVKIKHIQGAKMEKIDIRGTFRENLTQNVMSSLYGIGCTNDLMFFIWKLRLAPMYVSEKPFEAALRHVPLFNGTL